MSVFERVSCVFFNTDAGIECVRLSVFLCVLSVSGVCSSVFLPSWEKAAELQPRMNANERERKEQPVFLEI